VLGVVRQHALQTQGAFDITVGTYAARLRLARTAQDVAKVHQQLARFTGHQRWHMEDGALYFDNPCTRLDLGGVIKEYAVDESVRLAKAAGIPAGIVNYGGDLHTWGLKPDQQRFVAAIPDPRQPERMLFGLDLQDQALTTSGHYARNRAIKGGALSHVIGPDSVRSQRWLSVSVVSSSALVSGIYSTALLVRDDVTLPEQTFAVAVDQHGQVHPLHSNDMSRNF
jgi:thiamine biosynthesis lipoprotein